MHFEINSPWHNGSGNYFGIHNLRWIQCRSDELAFNLHCGDWDPLSTAPPVIHDTCTGPGTVDNDNDGSDGNLEGGKHDISRRSSRSYLYRGNSDTLCWYTYDYLHYDFSNNSDEVDFAISSTKPVGPVDDLYP